MIMSSSNLKYGFYALVTVLLGHLLSGCTESTNIATNDGRAVSECASLIGATCIKGRFVDEAVENLDYECPLPGIGTVRSRTDDEGRFFCPSSSIVTFSLTNPDDPTQKIILGEAKVTRPANIFAEKTPSLSFYVTPYSLAGGSNKQTSDRRALNIARLLHTLNTNAVPTVSASSHIAISTSDKSLIASSLFADVDNNDIFSLPPAPDTELANPADDTFDKAVKNYLTLIGKSQLIESAAAELALNEGVYSRFAGSYASAPIFPVTDPASAVSEGAMLGTGVGADADKRFLGQFWIIVDRRGRMIGSGIYSYGLATTTNSLASNPQAMDLEGFGSGGDKTWPFSGDLSGLKFTLRGASEAGRSVRITQGEMLRSAIAGSVDVYKRLFNGESLEGAKLGEWSLESAATTYVVDAPYTLEHTVEVAPRMNPAHWESPDLDFPIPIQVSLFNRDSVNCPSTKGCEIANVRMLILEDGNIVSDINDKCGVGLNPDTLRYDPSEQEYPLGVVRNIRRGGEASDNELDFLDESGDPITVMALMAVLPNNSELISAFANPGYEQYFPHTQFAGNFSRYSLLRADNGDGDQFQMYGLCTEEYTQAGVQLCSSLGSFAPGVAEWINYYTIARRQNSSTDALVKNSSGFMRSSRRTCS
jgi:hypothetical protein